MLLKGMVKKTLRMSLVSFLFLFNLPITIFSWTYCRSQFEWKSFETFSYFPLLTCMLIVITLLGPLRVRWIEYDSALVCLKWSLLFRRSRKSKISMSRLRTECLELILRPTKKFRESVNVQFANTSCAHQATRHPVGISYISSNLIVP